MSIALEFKVKALEEGIQAIGVALTKAVEFAERVGPKLIEAGQRIEALEQELAALHEALKAPTKVPAKKGA